MRVSKTTIISLLALAAILIGIPFALLTKEAHRTGQSLGAYLKRSIGRIRAQDADQLSGPSEKQKSRQMILFVEKMPIGDPVEASKPWISNLTIVDLDQDGLKDIVVCDAKLNQIRWIRQIPQGQYRELQVGTEIRAPARVAPCDIDTDGDLDLLIAKMGMIFPNNDRIGAVVVLENNGDEQFTSRVLIENIARVTDIQPGDFDGDGDIDLAVGQFGYDDGEIRWMENKGSWSFESHMLLTLSGTIHVPVADIDEDGDLDIIALVSQEWEEIYVFENDGQAKFKANMIYGSTNEDFGSSGISLVDLDMDGDLDILHTNGDAFDYIPPGPRPWHGVQWLENKKNLKFEYHRIGDFPGAYSAEAADVDQDGDLDIVVVSCFNNWEEADAQSMIWFENNGRMEFSPHDLVSNPTHLLVLDSGDMDGDGWVDFVTGGFYAYPPYDRMSRVLLWRNIWPYRRVIEK